MRNASEKRLSVSALRYSADRTHPRPTINGRARFSSARPIVPATVRGPPPPNESDAVRVHG